MSGFDASAIESLDFDFTEIPKIDGGTCSGKGVVCEPSTERITAFLSYFDDERRRILELAKTARQQAEAGEDVTIERPDLAAKFDEIRAVMAAFCAGAPTREELDELPPRALSAFVRWLLGEFSTPKG